MENIKVSIIIPTFNRAVYLKRALESALAQDYPDKEIIVADNASTDGTRELIERMPGGAGIVYCRSEKNLGMYQNWQKALYERAAGEWALILSDDDYLADPSFISKAMRLAAANPGMLLVSANYRTYYEAENRMEDRIHEAPGVTGGDWHFLNYGVKGSGYILASTLFKKNAVKDFIFFSRPELLGCDAFDFLRFGLHGLVGFIREPSSVITAHAGSQTRLAGLDAHFRNLEFIFGAYSYALENGFLPKDELDRWKKRLLRTHLEAILWNLCASGDAAGIGVFARRIWNEYPAALKMFLSPRVLARLALFPFPKVYRLAAKIRSAASGRRAA